MKICILHRYPLSLIEGTNPSLPVFLQKLVDQKHRVSLITYKDKGSHKLSQRIQIEDIKIEYRRERAFGAFVKSLFFMIIVPLKAWILDKREDFDLFYCDDSLPFYDLLVKLFTRKTVLIRRGDFMCGYMLNGRNPIKNILFKIAFLFEKLSWFKADGISVITETFKSYIAKHKVRADKIFVIEDSIDFEKFTQQQDSVDPATFTVMFHGTLMRLKGLETLIRAAAIVRDSCHDVKFLIIGDGEEYRRLISMVNAFKLQEYVTFTGWVDYAQIQDYLRTCDIGLPIRKNTLANNQIITTALLQYWATSKPVIAPRLAGISEIVKEDINGFLFEPDQPESLAKKIIKARSLKGERLERIGRNGREFAERKYNTKVIADKMCVFINNYS